VAQQQQEPPYLASSLPSAPSALPSVVAGETLQGKICCCMYLQAAAEVRQRCLHGYMRSNLATYP
jgi:hypothetical protein